jgi:hypothetical protein
MPLEPLASFLLVLLVAADPGPWPAGNDAAVVAVSGALLAA